MVVNTLLKVLEQLLHKIKANRRREIIVLCWYYLPRPQSTGGMAMVTCVTQYEYERCSNSTVYLSSCYVCTILWLWQYSMNESLRCKMQQNAIFLHQGNGHLILLSGDHHCSVASSHTYECNSTGRGLGVCLGVGGLFRLHTQASRGNDSSTLLVATATVQWWNNKPIFSRYPSVL